jgi:hypothetical protein
MARMLERGLHGPSALVHDAPRSELRSRYPKSFTRYKVPNPSTSNPPGSYPEGESPDGSGSLPKSCLRRCFVTDRWIVRSDSTPKLSAQADAAVRQSLGTGGSWSLAYIRIGAEPVGPHWVHRSIAIGVTFDTPIDEAVQSLQQKGVKFKAQLPRTTLAKLYLEDPDGNLLYLWETPLGWSIPQAEGASINDGSLKVAT